jgi:hypothetical protein
MIDPATKHLTDGVTRPIFRLLTFESTAPLLDSLQFWEGDLVNYFNHSTIYRGPPNEEREKAWLRLWDRKFVSKAALVKIK